MERLIISEENPERGTGIPEQLCGSFREVLEHLEDQLLEPRTKQNLQEEPCVTELRYLSTLIGLFIRLRFWRLPSEICGIVRSEGAESEVWPCSTSELANVTELRLAG